MRNVMAIMEITIPLSDEDYKDFKKLLNKGDDDSMEKAQDVIWECYYKKHEINGEAYLPAKHNELKEDFYF